MKRILILAAAILGSVMMQAQSPDYTKFGMSVTGESAPSGLQPGDKAPAFSGYDQAGKFTESAKLLQQGPMVLFFYRGNWCPYCNKELRNYQDSLNIISDQGFSLVAITPESIEYVETTVKVNNISFTVIYDCQEKIMKDYGVIFKVTDDYLSRLKSRNIDLIAVNGHPEAHLPVPATYIINREGMVVASWFDPDYKHRAPVKWIVQNLGKAL